MRAFKTKVFDRFAAHERISDSDLRDAIKAANAGLVDADLGGGVIKQRIARKGQGKSGGYRAIVLFKRTELAFFVYCFAKSERDNIRADELKAYRKLASEMLRYQVNQLSAAMANGTLKEISVNE